MLSPRLGPAAAADDAAGAGRAQRAVPHDVAVQPVVVNYDFPASSAQYTRQAGCVAGGRGVVVSFVAERSPDVAALERVQAHVGVTQVAAAVGEFAWPQ